MPGPTIGKLVPKVKDTAKILYFIYLVMSAAEVIFLLCGGMDLFDSLVHTFGTAGTGGFGVYIDSIASFTPYQQWVITIFMILFGINFNLYFLILIRRFTTAFRSSELWVYFGILASSIGIIFFNIKELFESASDAFRHAAFQVASVMTTTGYATIDFNTWPSLSKTVLLILMFIGACAGSTAGGFKVSRLILLLKNCRIEFRHLLHPSSVSVLRMDGKKVDGETRKGVNVYLTLYILCFFLAFFLLSLDRFDMETNFSAAAACFNNIGPGFGAVGPAASYANYSAFSKIVLSFTMLLGRLELCPIIMTLAPAAWRSRRK
jgi:trk system potassium uptake protein TrkH